MLFSLRARSFRQRTLCELSLLVLAPFPQFLDPLWLRRNSSSTAPIYSSLRVICARAPAPTPALRHRGLYPTKCGPARLPRVVYVCVVCLRENTYRASHQALPPCLGCLPAPLAILEMTYSSLVIVYPDRFSSWEDKLWHTLCGRALYEYKYTDKIVRRSSRVKRGCLRATATSSTRVVWLGNGRGFPQLLQIKIARFQKLLEMGVSNSAPENGTARLGGATFWKIVSLIGCHVSNFSSKTCQNGRPSF